MANKHPIPVSEPSILLEIINQYPLATVITHDGDSVEISQLPVVVKMKEDGKFFIQGHLSTRNPQWRHLKAGATMVLVFNGPNTYINSSWYKVNDVSTWNYISVQAEGLPELVDNHEGLLDILKATTTLANRLYKDQWDFYIPDDLKNEADLINSIGGFSLEPKKLSGKFKLSQSKSLEDQNRIIKELSLRDDENSKLIAKFMSDNIK
ncbi:FMN-binding negative transcriptional regulator [Bdellovibrio sp. HCB117]|uniref:FMN-binding negative transcriptional regulator n=1 Tax=Bdellovibrio sp. HCB117 TaxID=3394359 RepID=UPI0039B38F42